ncbi:MAG: hypothetical protein ING59_16645 [Burkholderiales bacterium]|nr:hypothetical protein [Burkholderiales bacterium]
MSALSQTADDRAADGNAYTQVAQRAAVQVAQALLAVRRGDRVAAEVHLVNAQRALLGLQAQFDWGSHDG